MVKHSHTHTNNFTPAVEDCYIFKAVTSAPADLGNTGLSPLILNQLRGTSCFLSGMFSLASSAFPLLLPPESHLTSM